MNFLLLLLILLLMSVSLRSQTTNKALAILSNSPITPPSYYQQLRDFEKSETDRLLSEKVKKYMQAPQKERKARELQDKMLSLEMEELAAQKKKEELEKQDVRQNLQQQMLYNYMKGLQEQSAQTKKTSPKKTQKHDFPEPTSTPAARAPQEAMKVEPPL